MPSRNTTYICSCCDRTFNEDTINFVDSVNEYVCTECLANEFFECHECHEYFPIEERYWGNGRTFCEECFGGVFTYCEDCDSLVPRDEAFYDDDNGPFCEHCYNIDRDDSFPENPSISIDEENEITVLCKSFLESQDIPAIVMQEQQIIQKPINIHEGDFRLAEIRDAVGEVDYSLEVFGLRDRVEYQITATPDIIRRVKQYIYNHNLGWGVMEVSGNIRIGISKSIRKNYFDAIVSLVKSIATNHQERRMAECAE